MKTQTEPFRSYSANFEDVLLNRVFGDTASGFFVDVGAAHPVMENDLYALYCRGWNGVNVEPNAVWFAEIEHVRPRDRNLNIALSDKQEQQTYFEVIDTGLSTLDPDEAMRCREQGWQVVEHRLQTRTLASILEEQPPSRFDILKVDVEGLEERVLLGNDWDRFRPSLILVEATLPERRTRRQTGIPNLLASKRYRHLHFDGLNDFYAEQDFHDADEVLGSPPGVFDHFVSYRIAELEQYNQSLRLTGEAAARDSQSRLDHLSASLDTLRQHAANLEAAKTSLQEQLARAAVERTGILASLKNVNQQIIQAAVERSEFMHIVEQHVATIQTLEARNACNITARFSRDDLSADVVRLKASVERLTNQGRQYSKEIRSSNQEREELLLLHKHIAHIVEKNEREAVRYMSHMGAMQTLQTQTNDKLAEQQSWLDTITRSTSWRVTLPLRLVVGSLKQILQKQNSTAAT